MSDSLTIEGILGRLSERYGPDPRVTAVYLYGSWARGRATKRSDVDVAFLLEGLEGLEIDDFIVKEMGVLSRLFQRDAQVVVLNRAPHLLRMQVFRKGRLVVEGDALAHRRFRAEAVIEAMDYLPFWSRHVTRGLREWARMPDGR
ncbi:MAG: nucleotidyltransferase domain-containing protein [Nitrospirae bacterium]|nr:nucleotidyltransferase domain-containing protein [Nitrospirota bacterium]